MYPPWIPQGYIKRIYFISQKPSQSQLLNSIPILFPTWKSIPGNGNGNGKLHSQILGTGTGMKNSFPNFGNVNWRPVFPKMVGNGNSRSPLGQRPFGTSPKIHQSCSTQASLSDDIQKWKENLQGRDNYICPPFQKTKILTRIPTQDWAGLGSGDR